MHFTALLTPVVVLLAGFVAAEAEPKPFSSRDKCLSNADASYLVNGFASLLTNFSVSEADKILAADFTDTSDSINFLAGIPAGSVTFPSRSAFIAGQGAEPPIGFNVISIDAVTCNVVAFRWVAILGPNPVKGINVFYATKKSGCWQIETNFSEFNVGAWELDIGGVCHGPTS